jgi:hypothetical protein
MLPSQGPVVGHSLFPAPYPQHETPTLATLPRGRPLPALLLPVRHSAPPRVARAHATPVAEREQWRPAPVPGEAYACTSPTPPSTLRRRQEEEACATAVPHQAGCGHAGERCVFKCFRRFRFMFQVFSSECCKSRYGILHMLQRQYTHVASLCFRRF